MLLNLIMHINNSLRRFCQMRLYCEHKMGVVSWGLVSLQTEGHITHTNTH